MCCTSFLWQRRRLGLHLVDRGRFTIWSTSSIGGAAVNSLNAIMINMKPSTPPFMTVSTVFIQSQITRFSRCMSGHPSGLLSTFQSAMSNSWLIAGLCKYPILQYRLLRLVVRNTSGSMDRWLFITRSILSLFLLCFFILLMDNRRLQPMFIICVVYSPHLYTSAEYTSTEVSHFTFLDFYPFYWQLL